MNKSRIFEVFEDRRQLFTKNLVPGLRNYDEKLFTEDNIEYRSWNPEKSKLAATIKKGCTNIVVGVQNANKNA